MAKILTGIQSTGTPHLGNILGAIIPAVDMANSTNDESYLFIANMHSLTQIKNKKNLKENRFSTAAYHSISDNFILSAKLLIQAINSLDDDVRISKRVYIPGSRLR